MTTGARRTHIPEDLAEVVEDVMGDAEYSVYVLDGQTADTDGGEDDWHDVLALAERGSADHLDDDLVKFTRRPDGIVEHYYPRHRSSPVTLVHPQETT